MPYDHSCVPPHLNPEPDPALAPEVAFFLRWGYLRVEAALTEDQVRQLRAALDAACARRGAALHAGGPSAFFHQLLEEDDRFALLLDNPPVLARMRALLGNCLQLHSATARVTLPGEPDQNWHRDGPWPVAPGGTPYGSLPAQINCGYYLDEVTGENGPLVVVPGSHRAPFRPPEGHPRFPEEQHLTARPGQAVLFDGWLYHRGAAHRGKALRRACLMCYQNAWMKSREPFDGPRVTRLRETGGPEVRLLLGGVPRW
jgi:hypothetical protein